MSDPCEELAKMRGSWALNLVCDIWTWSLTRPLIEAIGLVLVPPEDMWIKKSRAPIEIRTVLTRDSGEPTNGGDGHATEKRDGNRYREEPKRKVNEREGRVQKAQRHEEIAKDFGKGMEASTGRDGDTGRG
ncbi:hypothetical protein CKAH01_02328 [Colletotrichum kahawae]|uniref:Uncharacterized protein n=1 Tax=Colletotrichum kahawae TaxID=34407 RepID=A0AAE0CYK6_COLKA|nr:hypothetical protein CKAH01_02328 [Colletotrichum kahawae]